MTENKPAAKKAASAKDEPKQDEVKDEVKDEVSSPSKTLPGGPSQDDLNPAFAGPS